MPKIDDQTEISGTPRALNQQHLQKLRKKREFMVNLWRFYWFFRHLRCARGGRNFWPIGDFWPMMSYECWYEIICIYDTHIWKYDQKGDFYNKKECFSSKKNHLSDIKLFKFLILIKKSYQSWSKTWITMYMC